MTHHTMTLEEWRAQQTGATRPVTDPFMSTAKAERSRSLSAIAITSSAEDDALAKLVADRQRRKTANSTVSTGRVRGEIVCGTPEGYRAHYRAKQTCVECTDAFRAHMRALGLDGDSTRLVRK